MAFVRPDILQKILGGAQNFGQQLGAAPQSQQMQLAQMLAGAGAGMSQAAGQPGANFGQALGGGAAGMMQGQQQAQQQQMMQQQMEAQRSKQEREERLAKGWQELLYGKQDFASQVDTGGVAGQQDTLSGASVAPAQQGGPMAAQAMPTEDIPIGTLASMFESNARPDAVNNGRGDPGGASYGRYQLASKSGTLQSFFDSEEGQPFATQFGDLEPGSPQFNQVWQEVANDPNAGPAFDQAQQQYMERTHFRPALDRAQRAGFDVENPGVREAIASIGTQHSGSGGMQIMNDAMARVGRGASPDEVVEALYDARASYVKNLPEDPEGERGMAPAIKKNVLSRYDRERGEAKRLASVGMPPPAAEIIGGGQQPQQGGYGQPQGGLNVPEEIRPLLAMLGPEQGAKLLAQQAFASPQEQPAAVREALFMAGGDEDLARQIMLEKQAGGDSAAEQTIQRLMETGMTREQAIGIHHNRVVVSHDPISREAFVMDKLTGERIGSATPEQLQEYERPNRQTLIPEDLDLTKATGAGGALRQVWNRVQDAAGFNLSEAGEEAEQAIQALNNLSIQTETALAQEIAGRPSNYLLERLRETTIEPAKLFQGDQVARERLRATTALIDQKIDMVNDVVDNPHHYRPAEVSEARRNQTQLRYLKDQYDTALRIFEDRSPRRSASQGSPDQGPLAMPEDVPPMPEGLGGEAAELWQYMTPEERALWQ